MIKPPILHSPSGLYLSTFPDLHFSWRIEFYGLNQNIGPCSWGFIWGTFVGSRSNALGRFGHFADPRFSNSLSMHYMLTWSFPILVLFLSVLDLEWWLCLPSITHLMATQKGKSCEHITIFFLSLMHVCFLADTNAAEVKLFSLIALSLKAIK